VYLDDMCDSDIENNSNGVFPRFVVGTFW
jgi:hypothetical protein